jgi:hypothetical protein
MNFKSSKAITDKGQYDAATRTLDIDDDDAMERARKNIEIS